MLFGGLMLVLPLMFKSGFALTILSQMGVMIIFAVAYNMLLGQSGMLSLGHAIFFGMAGYFTVHFINQMQDENVHLFPITLIPLFGGVVGLFFGVLIGFISTRHAGTTFAMISLGFGEMFTALTLVLVTFFNGEDGIQTDRVVGSDFLGVSYGPSIEIYYLIAAWCMLAILAMYGLTRTPFGRMSNAVRDNPERAEFIGYNTQRVRWLAFSLSSFFAGLAGSLHALNYEHVGFETVGAQTSGLVLFMAYIGGISSFLGPIIGAVLITLLNSVLSDFTEAWFLYLGIIFIVVVMFAPQGLAGLITMHQPQWHADPRLLRRLIVPYMAASGSTLLAASGIIGVIELIYHVRHDASGSPDLQLFWMNVNSSIIWTWLACGVAITVGVYLCRFSYPAARSVWDETLHTARQKLTRVENR